MKGDAQARAQTLINEIVGDGLEQGVQVAAYLGEELVVDAWAGTANAAGRLVNGETLFTVFSTTKGIVATAVHLLVDRGQLAYDTPIAAYWPEFGANGKEGITLRHALTHTAGVPHLPPGTGPREIGDWDGICRGIARLAPLWAPGTRFGYHALTYGWLLGEVVRRVDGRPFGHFVAEELAAPLGISDLYLGIPDGVEGRLVTLEGPPAQDPPPALPNIHALTPQALTPEVIGLLAVPPSLLPLHVTFNRPDVRRACIPGGGGIMTARAIARHYAALACGGTLDGVRLLAPERVREAAAIAVEEGNSLDGVPFRRGLGYMLGNRLLPMGDRPSAFGHAGYGGSIGFADPAYRFAFGLAKTTMVETPPPSGETATRVARAVREALGIPEAG